MLKKLLVVAAATAALAAPAARAQETIKIGLMEDFSGIFADIAGKGSALAAKFAIEDAGGSVLGRKVELVTADHQNKPDVAAAIVTEWIKVKKFDMITGVSASAAAMAVRQIARDNGVLDIMSSGGTVDLTNKACSPTGFHWSWDSYMLAKSTGEAVVKDGGKDWFFLATDTPFGAASQRDTTAMVEAAGGKVVGSVKVRQGLPDMSSFLLQAQGSGAKVVGLAIAGSDFINAVRQASEFGLTKNQSLAALVAFITDVHSLGLRSAQGMYISEPFYWNLNEDTRKWSRRFYEQHKAMPTTIQAGIYSAVYHYLKAVKAAGTTEPKAVAAKIRELPVNDFWTVNAKVREDGRVMRPVHLFKVKTPAESKEPWDYYKLISTLPAEAAARPLSMSECSFVAKR